MTDWTLRIVIFNARQFLIGLIIVIMTNEKHTGFQILQRVVYFDMQLHSRTSRKYSCLNEYNRNHQGYEEVLFFKKYQADF